ncbi:hypothetical protein [Rheinheimera sp.]|uniref:hypothetical protein n=1 Tax=Rheinheimera sp. TaxID=1869214 RepID=UPI00273663CB|nr:hypothetical protein [Rheinheimera sp.]MDP2714010.1 hypothetical protein [Rheinheimera sp.]
MKTLSALTLAVVITVGFAAPAQANTITDTLTETVSNQLTELSSNIKQQAKTALEQTIAELLFAVGSEQAEQNVAQTTAAVTTKQQ